MGIRNSLVELTVASTSSESDLKPFAFTAFPIEIVRKAMTNVHAISQNKLPMNLGTTSWQFIPRIEDLECDFS